MLVRPNTMLSRICLWCIPPTPTPCCSDCSYRQLGQSDLVVSEVCLGTMTWGEQNSDEEAFEQLDFAFDRFGVNFVVSIAQHLVLRSCRNYFRAFVLYVLGVRSCPFLL